jgi:3',5'-cyclic AMP phosphodiesterase CpdA
LDTAGGSTDFDCVVVSGDFFSDNDLDERHAAQDELTRMTGVLGGAIYPVPGNHDITWVPQLSDRPLYFYDELLNEIGLAEFGSDQLPRVLELAHTGERALAVVLLDSCRVESEVMAGIGRIGDDQLDRVASLLREGDISPDSHTLVAVLHHHLLPVSPIPLLPPGADPRVGPVPRSSHTVDAVEVLRRLAELGVSVVMHGHEHWSAVVTTQNAFWGTRAIHVAAGGSCGLDKQGVRRQFAVWELSDDDAVITQWVEHHGSPALFEPDPAHVPAPRLELR